MRNFALTFLSALCLISCEEKDAEPTVVSAPVETPVVACRSLATVSCPFDMKVLDLLIYSGDGIRSLEKHIRAEPGSKFFADSIEVPSGNNVAVCVVNAPGKLNDSALSRYDAIDELVFQFASEKPDYPSGSCIVPFTGGEDILIEPDKLLCCIEIASIDSEINIYDLELYLVNVPADCEVFKWQGFHSSQMLCQYSLNETDLSTLAHPEMIYRRLDGFQDWRYTLYPGIRFHCYPNDAEDGDFGSPRTKLVLQGHILDGILVSYEEGLPSLERGSLTSVWIDIRSETEWEVSYFHE